ncbi:MAG: hypothetical protein M1818_001192 [Claussenomyces sp. TS43310]|nr:MAG: hypothetical protein M1818_001192 [Claussenomyces sp. TS43310]
MFTITEPQNFYVERHVKQPLDTGSLKGPVKRRLIIQDGSARDPDVSGDVETANAAHDDEIPPDL